MLLIGPFLRWPGNHPLGWRLVTALTLPVLCLFGGLGCPEERATPLDVRPEKVAGTGAPALRPEPPPPSLSVRQVMVGRFEYYTFLDMLEVAGLTRLLDEAEGPLTVFVPDVRAFRRADYELFASMNKPAHRAQLRQLLLAHIVPGKRLSVADLAQRHRQRLRTAAGTTIAVRMMGGAVHVRQQRLARIERADLQAANGIVHLINRVIAESLATLPRAEPTEDKEKPVPPQPSVPQNAKRSSGRSERRGGRCRAALAPGRAMLTWNQMELMAVFVRYRGC